MEIIEEDWEYLPGRWGYKFHIKYQPGIPRFEQTWLNSIEMLKNID